MRSSCSAARRLTWRCVALAGLISLTGCGSGVSRFIGLTRDPPDEFTVTTRAPLTMPTDFSLPPPTPGASRPQEMSEQQQAEATLAPQTALEADTNMSAGEQAVVHAAGPPAPGNIRNQVNAEVSLDRPKRSLSDILAFWRPAPPAGTAVDPKRESQRLRQNAALGQPPDTGNTPIIQRRQQGFLDQLF